MADHMRDGAPADFRVLEEFLLTMCGRRLVSWSRDIRGLLGLGRERSDEEIAAESDAAQPQVLVADRLWERIDAARLTVAVLEAGEARGLRGVVVLLEAAGVEVVVDVERDGRWPPRLSCALRAEWRERRGLAMRFVTSPSGSGAPPVAAFLNVRVEPRGRWRARI